MRADDVMVVVLTRNRRELCRSVVEELVTWKEVGGITVIDNASVDGTATMLAAEFPSVRVVSTSENLGVTGGINLGLEDASRDGFRFAFLVEDDTVPSAEALRRCRIVAGLRPDAVFVGTGGGVFRWGLVRWGRYRRSVGEGDDDVQSCDFVLLDNCLVELDLLRCIGPLRDDFFIMLQEQEIGWRARRGGFELVRVAVDVVRRAEGAASASRGSPWRSYYQTRNYLRFVIDARSIPLWCGFVARHVHQVGSEVRRRKWSALSFRWQGALDAIRGRMGLTVLPPDVDRSAAVTVADEADVDRLEGQ